MNDNREYGVELDLKTNKFRNSLRNIANTVKEATERMKQNLSTGFNMDRSQAKNDIERSMKMIEDYQNKIEDFQRQFGNVSQAGVSSTGWTVNQKQIDQIDTYRRNIEGLNKSIEATKQDLQTLDSSPMARLGEIAGKFRDRITSAWNRIRNLRSGVNELGTDGAADIDKMNSELKETDSISSRIKQGFGNLGNTIQNGFDKGIKSVKRFALSLFGIHSIWRVVSRAASSYLAYDTDLANKIEGNWVALGAMLEPILTWLVEILRYVVAYLNVFIKALTGVDFIARANKKIENSSKKTTKAVKELNRELTSLDEITNLTFDEQNANLDEDDDFVNPLAGFEDIELDPNIVKFIETVAEKLKDLWNWLVENKDMLEEIGKVALVAFAGWKIGSVIGDLAKLLGVAGGTAGLFGLVGALAAVDVYLGVKLVQDIKELHELTKRNEEAQKATASSIVDQFNKILEILQTSDKQSEGYQMALGNINTVYEAYLKQLKDGYKYTEDQKNEIAEITEKIENLTGKKFKTEIEAELDVYPNQQSLNRTSSLIGNAINKVIGVFGGGGGGGRFATGTVAYRPTYGEFGEYSGASTNPEIVSPQNIMEETLYTALSRALPLINGGNQPSGDIVLEINGREFARATYDDFEYEGTRLGKNTAIRRY